MAEGDTFINALIGAAVTVVAGAFIPFGTVVGGGVAGYLEGGSREDGLRVGAIAGALAMIPFLLLFLMVSSIIFGAAAGPVPMPFAVGGAGIVVLLFVFLFVVVYVVGLSALGGYLGNYVKYDTDIDI